MNNQYDYDEEQKLKDFAKETVQIADEYANSRAGYAEAKLKIDDRLTNAYKTGLIKETLAVEKAYIRLMEDNPEAKAEYESMIREEQAYKGLEEVLKARAAYVSLHQSLIKVKQQTGVA